MNRPEGYDLRSPAQIAADAMPRAEALDSSGETGSGRWFVDVGARLDNLGPFATEADAALGAEAYATGDTATLERLLLCAKRIGGGSAS